MSYVDGQAHLRAQLPAETIAEMDLATPPADPVARIVSDLEKSSDWGWAVHGEGVVVTGALGVALLRALRSRRVQVRRERGEVVR